MCGVWRCMEEGDSLGGGQVTYTFIRKLQDFTYSGWGKLTCLSPSHTCVNSCWDSSCSLGGRATIGWPSLSLLVLVRRRSTGARIA